MATKTHAETFHATFGVWPTAAATLRVITIDSEGIRASYLRDLRACVDAGLVIFADEGRGAPRLTEKGKRAVRGVDK